MTLWMLKKDFVDDPITLHDTLWRELPLVRHPDRPRHECWMNSLDLPYTSGKGPGARTYQPTPWHNAIAQLRLKLVLTFAISMDCCFVNGYKDGRDHLGWHADDSPEMDDARPIVVVSLGAEREIWVRENPKEPGQPGAVEHILLTAGSAFIMPAGFQDTHQHRIPKSSVHNCPPRLSLTFRGLVPLPKTTQESVDHV